MLYANDKDGKRILPVPLIEGLCPMCNGEMVPKCGDVKIWHWAHKSACPYDKELETQWHREWKSQFPPDWVEVVVEASDGKHRADIKTDYQMVIEFQHSSISSSDINKRERAYNFMIWVFDCMTAWEEDRLKRKKGLFEWYNPRKIFSGRKPIFLQLEDNLLARVTGKVSIIVEGNIPLATFDGVPFNKSEFIDFASKAPSDLYLACPYGDKPRLIGYEVCKQHRSQNDPECNKPKWPWEELSICQQWRWPIRYPEFLS